MVSDARREYKKRYNAENRARIKAQRAEYYIENRERILAHKAEYNTANRDKISAYNKKRYAETTDDKAEYYAKNRERILEQQQKYYNANPEKNVARVEKRRAALAGVSTPLTTDEKRLVEQYHSFRIFLHGLFGIEFAIDHTVPISVGGADHPDNYQIITKSENSRKGSKLDYELPAKALCFRLHTL